MSIALSGSRSDIRPLDSFAIQVSLLTVPVRMVPIQRDGGTDFHSLHSDCPSGSAGEVGRKQFCKGCGKELEAGEVIKGYKIGKGEYVPFTPGEVDSIRSLIKGFNTLGVREVSYGTEMVSATYLLLPDPKAKKAYALLMEGLKRAGKAVLGTFTRSTTDYFAVIHPSGKVLTMDLLRWSEEVVNLGEISPDLPAVAEQDAGLAAQLLSNVAAQTGVAFDGLRSTVKERIEAAVEAKLRGESIPIQAETSPPKEADLSALLKQAVQATAKA